VAAYIVTARGGRNRVDIGRQIARDEIRAAKKKVAELSPVVAEDREWLNRMKDAAEFHEACAAALRKMLDAHFATECLTGV
jgi:predicted DNA-binding protein (UPF0278 family)